MSLKRVTDGGLGAKPPTAGRYFVFLTILMPLEHILLI